MMTISVYSNNSTNITLNHLPESIDNSMIRISIGLLYIVLSSCFSLLYSMIFYLLITDRNQWKFSFHKLIVSLAIADMIQLIFNGLSGGIFNLTNKCPFFINKLFGSFSNASWFVSTATAHGLAINRFVSIIFNSKMPKIFSPIATNVYVLILWLYGMFWFVCHQFLGMNVLYSIEFNSWDFVETKMGEWGKLLNMSLDIVNIAMMLVWYLCVYAYLKHKVSRYEFIVCFSGLSMFQGVI